jgi:ribosomal protein S18 acetylase RimI-like enzyme/predicted nucleic acid-binding protein
MNVNIVGVRQKMGLVYRAEKDVPALLQRFAAIRMLADGEREALGFLPEAAYREAIEHGRLIAMIVQINGRSELAGFILFSGVFPNARIQQVVVAGEYRRAGVASALVSELVSQLEVRGYLTVTAAVASDLSTAQAFYQKNGFVARRSHQGGQTRHRTIILRARDLETASFFSLLEPRTAASPNLVDLGLRQRSARQAPLYAIDLNVLFDLIKDRTRSALANRLFGSALAHQIRLAVAPEFIGELQRTSTGEENDHVLKLARQLPRLPVTNPNEIQRLASLVHNIVFVANNLVEAGSPRALSDARHLAQAALARASGYVTSDSKLLDARAQLFEQIGIDVASLDEFVTLLPDDYAVDPTSQLKGTDVETKALAAETLRTYLTGHRIPSKLVGEFIPDPHRIQGWKTRAIIESGEVVGVGVCLAPDSIDAPARILVHVRPDHVACETFADHLLDTQIREACASGPVTIELPFIAGQGAVRRHGSRIS